jgi:hypothetical protein
MLGPRHSPKSAHAKNERHNGLVAKLVERANTLWYSAIATVHGIHRFDAVVYREGTEAKVIDATVVADLPRVLYDAHVHKKSELRLT